MSSPGAPAPPSIGGLADQLNKAGQALSGIFTGKTAQLYGQGYSQLSQSLPSLTVSRVVTIIIGMVLIIAGIFALTKEELPMLPIPE
jgi:hypothetical protein